MKMNRIALTVIGVPLALPMALLFLGQALSQTPPAPPSPGPPIGGPTGVALSLLNTLTNAARTVKGTPGVLKWVQCVNPNAATIGYVQVFDAASGNTWTLGSSTPRASFGFQAAASMSYQVDATMVNGIKIAAATTALGGAALGVPLDCNAGFQ